MPIYMSEGNKYFYQKIPEKFDLLEVGSNQMDMITLKIVENFKYAQLGIDLQLNFGKLDDLKEYNRNNINEIMNMYSKYNIYYEKNFKDVYDKVVKDLSIYEKIRIFINPLYSESFLIPYYFIYEFWDIVKDKEISLVYYNDNLENYFKNQVSEAAEDVPTYNPNEDKTMNYINNHKITKILETKNKGILNEVDNIVLKLLNTEIILTDEEKRVYKEVWEKELQLNSDIRILENNEIVDYSYDEIEHKILNEYNDVDDYQLYKSNVLKTECIFLYKFLKADMIKKGLIPKK